MSKIKEMESRRLVVRYQGDKENGSGCGYKKAT